MITSAWGGDEEPKRSGMRESGADAERWPLRAADTRRCKNIHDRIARWGSARFFCRDTTIDDRCVCVYVHRWRERDDKRSHLYTTFYLRSREMHRSARGALSVFFFISILRHVFANEEIEVFIFPRGIRYFLQINNYNPVSSNRFKFILLSITKLIVLILLNFYFILYKLQPLYIMI